MEIVDHGQLEMIAVLIAAAATAVTVLFLMTYGYKLILEVKESFYACAWFVKMVFRNII